MTERVFHPLGPAELEQRRIRELGPLALREAVEAAGVPSHILEWPEPETPDETDTTSTGRDA